MSIELTPQESEAALTQPLFEENGVAALSDGTPAVNPVAEAAIAAATPTPTVEAIVADAVPAPAPAPETPPAQKTCDITEVLSTSLIELLKLSPENPIVRTQAHVQMLLPIPDEAKSFEQIQEWIEHTIIPRSRQGSSPQARAPGAPPSFYVTVEQTEYNRGACRYTVQSVGSANYEFDPDEMAELVRNAGSLGDLVEDLRSEAREHAEIECEPNWDTAQYSHHEHRDTEDTDTSTSRTAVEDQVCEWLRQYRPEEYRRLT